MVEHALGERDDHGGSGSSNAMLYLLTLLGCIGGLLFGYDTGIISGALPLISDDFELDTVDKEFLVSLTVIGAFVGSVCAGSLGDYFGRRLVVMASSTTFTTGAILMGFAKNLGVLLLGRFTVGLGVGSASMIVPLYLAECAPAEHRGMIVACVNVNVAFGELLASIVAASYSDKEGGWRFMLGLAAIPAAIQFIGFFFFVPESPRFTLSTGDVEKGKKALQWLRRSADVDEELEQILSSLREEKDSIAREFLHDNAHSTDSTTVTVVSAQNPLPFKVDSSVGSVEYPNVERNENCTISSIGSSGKSPSLWRLLQKPTTRRALILGCCLQAGNQLAGINTVMYYGATIFTMSGTDTVTAIWLTMGLSACNFVGSSLSSYLQDKVGRRTLTLYSMVGLSFGLVLIASAFWATGGDTETNDNASDNDSSSGGGLSSVKSGTWVVFSAICFYLLCFSVGMGSTPWTICAEIYPTSVRGAANSITTGVNWAATFIMSMSFLSIVKAVGDGGAFLLYAAVSFSLYVMYLMYLPETKNIALEDVPALFSESQWGKQRHSAGYGYGCVPEDDVRLER